MTTARTAVGLAAAFALLPWLVADYHRLFAAEILVWGLLAMSFGLVYGYGGMLSFAQAVFFGWGCWGYNVASFLLQWNTWGALGLAMVAAAAFAVPIGYIATRVRQHHFLIVTVIVSVLVSAVLSSGHWRWIAGPYVTRSLTFVPEVPLGVVRLSYADARGIPLETVCDWMAAQPAALAGLQQKGGIAPGKDADLLFFRPDDAFTVNATSLHHRHPLTPYLEESLFGTVQTTFIRGRKVYHGGQFVGQPQGKLLNRS